MMIEAKGSGCAMEIGPYSTHTDSDKTARNLHNLSLTLVQMVISSSQNPISFAWFFPSTTSPWILWSWCPSNRRRCYIYVLIQIRIVNYNLIHFFEATTLRIKADILIFIECAQGVYN